MGRNTHKKRLTVPFGMRNGRPVFVSEVAPGVDCGCTCPECGEPLIARNRDFPNRRRVRHFQHARASVCGGGFETAIHRMAKEILATSESLLLPRWASGEFVIEPEPFAVTSARIEASLLDGAVRPDALMRGAAKDIEFRTLCVEVRVHHAVDETKRSLLSNHGLDAIEIDLSGLPEEAIADPSAFRNAVLHEASNRHWITLSHASYVSERTGQVLIEVEDLDV
jgi:hypothetical protein